MIVPFGYLVSRFNAEDYDCSRKNLLDLRQEYGKKRNDGIVDEWING